MSGMTHEEILRDAKEMAVHYPDDRLKLTGREILDFVAPFEARISTLEQERDVLRAALKDLLWAGSRASIGDNHEYRMAEDAARAALSGAPKEGT